MEFFHHESCGKCTPCREGLGQVLGLLDKFVDGTATEADLKLLRNLLDVMSQASLCGLGQAAPTAIKRFFSISATSSAAGLALRRR